MKKLFYMVTMMVASFAMSSCTTMGGSSTSNTSNNTGAALTSALGTALTSSSSASSTTNILGSLLSTLLGSATTSKQTIVGTWTYNAPEVRFESESVLTQIGGTLMGEKISSALGTQLTRIGLKKGQSKFTFASDGTLTVTMGTKKTNGTYTYNSSNQTVTMKGALGLTSITATVAVTGNNMYLLFDSSKLLSMMTKLGSSTSALSSITSLIGNYSGLKLGWSMTK